MGQKCSCLYKKEDANTYHFPPQDDKTATGTDVKKSKASVIYNNEFSLAVNKKNGGGSMVTPTSDLENTNTSYSWSDEKLLLKLIRMQSLSRGFLYKKQFRLSVKQILINEAQTILNEYKSNFKLNSLYQDEYKYPSFDPKGWTKYDSESDPKLSSLNLDYSTAYNTTILIDYTNNNFYTGQVNKRYHKQGYGIFYIRDGSKYQGHWRGNEFAGWGRYSDKEGNLLEGNI